MVTRVSKHWFYGALLNEQKTTESGKEKIMIRGWFPRICARRL